MRAADDFTAIRARMLQLERERRWAAESRKQELRDEKLDRMDFRAAQEMRDEIKARIIARNRFG